MPPFAYAVLRKIGRDDWIRTSDPLLPKQMRYQAAPRPDGTDRELKYKRNRREPATANRDRGASSNRPGSLREQQPRVLHLGDQRAHPLEPRWLTWFLRSIGSSAIVFPSEETRNTGS